MNVGKRLLKQKTDKKQVLRGVDPFEFRIEDINYVVDVLYDKIKEEVMSRTAREYEKTWTSYDKMIPKATDTINHKPIIKYDRAIDSILNNLKKDLDISIRHSFNKGPVYSWRTDRNNHFTKDWISVPKPYRFSEMKLYYKTVIHELAHASCSRPRLCLKFKVLDEEEIAAESTALIISFLLGVNVWDDCLAYMTNWNFDPKDETIAPVVKTNRDWKSLKQKVKRIIRYMLIG